MEPDRPGLGVSLLVALLTLSAILGYAAYLTN